MSAKMYVTTRQEREIGRSWLMQLTNTGLEREFSRCMVGMSIDRLLRLASVVERPVRAAHRQKRSIIKRTAVLSMVVPVSSFLAPQPTSFAEFLSMFDTPERGIYRTGKLNALPDPDAQTRVLDSAVLSRVMQRQVYGGLDCDGILGHAYWVYVYTHDGCCSLHDVSGSDPACVEAILGVSLESECFILSHTEEIESLDDDVGKILVAEGTFSDMYQLFITKLQEEK